MITTDRRAADGMAALREHEERRKQEAFEQAQRALETRQRAEQSVAMCASEGWPLFIAWLDELRSAALTSLLGVTDIGDVRAFQAQVNLIDQVKQYQEIVKREAAEAATVASSFGSRA